MCPLAALAGGITVTKGKGYSSGVLSVPKRPKPFVHPESLKPVANHDVPRLVPPELSYFQPFVIVIRLTMVAVTFVRVVVLLLGEGFGPPGVGPANSANVMAPLGVRPCATSVCCGP